MKTIQLTSPDSNHVQVSVMGQQRKPVRTATPPLHPAYLAQKENY